MTFESITALHQSSPETKIIMLSDQKQQDDGVHSALKSGVRGFLVKQSASADVSDATARS